MSWATDAKNGLVEAKADVEAIIAIIDVVLPELEEGTPEKEAAEDTRSQMVVALAAIDAALLIVDPFA